jgi:hypothetical protein
MNTFLLAAGSKLTAMPQDCPPPLPLKIKKRRREVERRANNIPTDGPRKRLRSLTAGPSLRQTSGQEAVSGISASQKRHSPIRKPQSIKEQQVVRKSARLQATPQLQKQPISKSKHIQELQAPPSPPASKIPEGRVVGAFCFSCRAVSLTRSSYCNVHRSINPPRFIRNLNNGKKLNGPLKTGTGPLRSDLEPRLQVARPREDWRRKRRPIIKGRLIRSRLGFRAKGGLVNTSNKTGKISNTTAGWRNKWSGRPRFSSI